jgi:hypothetical protein
MDTIGLLTANGESSHEASILSNGFTRPTQLVAPQRNKSKSVQFKSKSVQFKTPIVEQDDDDDSSDSEDDQDFEPDEASPGSDVSMDEDSDDSDSDSDDASDSDASSSDSDSDSSSASDSSSDSSRGPEVHKIQHPKSTTNGMPGKGLKQTRSRNHRRRDAGQLKKLKTLGVLHEDASLEDMKSWNSEDAAAREQRIAQAKERAASEGVNVSGQARKRKRGAVEPMHETLASDGLAELQRRKQELMTRMEEEEEEDEPLGAPISTESNPTTTTTEPVSTPVETKPSTIEPIPTLASAAPTRKRLRPDTSAISRILARQTQVRICSYIP